MFIQNCEICVAVYSNIRKPPSCQVFRIEHNGMTVDGIHLLSVGFLVENSGKYFSNFKLKFFIF